jgi:very-short-patch-repair endonuclease
VLSPAAERPEVTCPPGRRTRRDGIVCRRSSIAPDEWEGVEGIPVTAVFRTIFDLAVDLDERELERAWHEALVRELTAAVSLPTLLERYPGRRGNRALRALIQSDRPVGISRNDFEEAFLTLIDAHGLPRPRMNATLALRGRFYEIDALWASERVVVELDSRSVHGSPKHFESDRQRDRVLIVEGYRTIRVTWHQLKNEPAQIVSDLLLALRPPAHRPYPPGK